MRKGASIPARSGFEAYGIGFLNPFFNADFIAIQPDLAFNYGEFAIIKSRIVYTLPYSQKFNSISVS